jgi:predicted nucleic acid-binding protein
MIVVDTNLIGYLYLENSSSALAEQALLKYPHWAAPILWRSEFRNVLALYLRKHWLSLDESQQIMSEALHSMADREYEVDSEQVLRLVTQSTCSAYDCEFVALAQELGTYLVTADKQILREFPQVAVSLAAFVSGLA